jgi:hypothetical protein
MQGEVRLDERGIESKGEQRGEIRQRKEAVWNCRTVEARPPHLHQGARGAEDEKRESDGGGENGEDGEDGMS